MSDTICIAHFLKGYNSGTWLLNLSLKACVCVREREREETMLNVLQSDQLNASKATIITSNLVVACVTRERNREMILLRKIRLM